MRYRGASVVMALLAAVVYGCGSTETDTRTVGNGPTRSVRDAGPREDAAPLPEAGGSVDADRRADAVESCNFTLSEGCLCTLLNNRLGDCEWSVVEALETIPHEGWVLNGIKIQLPGSRMFVPHVSTSTECNSESGGWYYDDLVGPTAITLCSSSCQVVSDVPDAALSLILPCPVVDI